MARTVIPELRSGMTVQEGKPCPQSGIYAGGSRRPSATYECAPVAARERDFRDFFRLRSPKENRYRTIDLAAAALENSVLEQRKGSFMSTDAEKNKEFESAVKALINVLQDSQKGFADIGEHLKDETLKRYFLAESLKRANFRAELENELHRHGVADVHETGTVLGAAHRVWGDLKAKISSGDHTLLETAEQGEDVAKKGYEEALKAELPLPLHQLIAEQQKHVLTSHDYVKAHRDALAGK